MGEKSGIEVPGFDASLEVGGTSHTPLKKHEENKHRIPLILDLIEQHWIEEPHLPFGRLLAKINKIYGGNHDNIYIQPDNELLNNLENYGEMGNE